MTKKVMSIFGGREEVDKMADIIASTFKDFDVPVEIVESIEGYSSYHFHVRPTKPMRMKAFAGFVEDLKYALSNDSVEIVAPLPNKKLVGITVQKKEDLSAFYFADALKWPEFTDPGAQPLVVPIGIDEFGHHHLLNIARMPHLLIAGTTGSGKSILLHSFINALLEKNTPEQLRFILIDAKRVEMPLYNGLPHLFCPTITQAKRAVQALSWAVKEMERRYDILQAEGKINVAAYHKDTYHPALAEWKRRGSKESTQMSLPESVPYIVIIIDELNDIMTAYPNEMETCVVRLAQMARPTGIHLVLSTQRPSVNVITGSVKANIPARVALNVASQVDSRTILDVAGAEKLRGQGDMLFQPPDEPRPIRLQGLYVSEEEIMERVAKLRETYAASTFDTIDFEYQNDAGSAFGEFGEEEAFFEEVKEAVVEAGKASTSFIQRKFRIGYSRAARLMDLLEERGVIGPQDGSSPRNVLIDPE